MLHVITGCANFFQKQSGQDYSQRDRETDIWDRLDPTEILRTPVWNIYYENNVMNKLFELKNVCPSTKLNKIYVLVAESKSCSMEHRIYKKYRLSKFF